MFRRTIALALCLILAASLLPAANAFGREPIAPESVDRCCHTLRVDPLDANYVRPAYDGKLIEITPQRVQDTFDYLDEHYVKNHPEQALMVYTGTAKDKEVLKTLAETITAGCTTDREKANAIDSWLQRNIYYDVATSAYASDTFYRREGNCLSYANLMQFLLRSLGIPAVMGDGWRGDMKTSTVELFNMEGHAWCFVLLDGEWVMYDPLWLSGGTTDRAYMAEWIYFDTVETICPASDGDDLPPEAYDKSKAYYTDGKFYAWSEYYDNTLGVLTSFINNQAYAYVANQCHDGYGDGWYYLDGRDKSSMERGELYSDGWGCYGDYNANKGMSLTYFFPNAMTADGYVANYDGKDLLMYTNTSNEILIDDYDITDGKFTLKPGYSGPFLAVGWQDGCLDSRYEYVITWESRNPEIVSVDQSGNITCLQEGYADVWVTLQRVERDGRLTSLSTELFTVVVSNEARVPDYQDYASHEHEYRFSHTVAPTCTEWGYEVHQCIQCPVIAEVMTKAPLGHDHSIIAVTEPTCVSGGYTTRTCSRCGASYTEEPTPIDSEGHVWDGTVCTLCGDTRLTPFDDVAESSFYESPVAWAVGRGITNGISATEFGPTTTCNRAQVVTFLWRAAGSPEPQSMNNPFVDVQAGSFYEKPVLWAVENGVTNGTDATHFGPNESCNRASVVTFLWRAAGRPTPAATDIPFTDVPTGTWYTEPVLWALGSGITNGISATEFGANSPCNRAQVVTFLYRAFGE